MQSSDTFEPKNFTVGSFTVFTTRNLIVEGDLETQVTPKMLAVLIELAKFQGQTLSKEQLILSVWGTPHTSDMVLSRAISDLRKVFGDSAKVQSTIETVSKQGYRLKEKVTWLSEENANAVDENTVQGISESEVTNQGYSDKLVADQLAKEKVPAKESPNEELPSTKLPSTKSSSKEALSKESTSKEPSNTESVKKTKLIPVKVITILAALVLILIVCYLALNVDKSPTPPITTFDVEQITNDGESKRFVRFSADGKYIAYSVGDLTTKGHEIVLLSLDNNDVQPIELTEDDSLIDSDLQSSVYYDFAPAFSPDGTTLAFKHFTQKNCTIVGVNLDSFKKRNVTNCPISKTHALDWSPDGTQLVTTVFNPIKNIESLALIDVNTGGINLLPPPKHNASGYLWPRFSPNNKDIAVAYFRPNDSLWIVGTIDIDSGSFSALFSSADQVSQVVWDETGNFLYYLVVGGEAEGIWKLELANKKVQKVLTTQSSSLDFDITNNQFASIKRERKFNIWKTGKDKDTGELISKPQFAHLSQTHSPSLSPDNSKLAFITSTSNIDSLWLNIRESEQNILLYQSAKDEVLSDINWSSSNRHLLFTSRENGESKIIEIDLELGESATLLVNQNNVKKGKWSHDGQHVYWYESGEDSWRVIEKNLQTSQQKVLLEKPISRYEVIDGHIIYQKIGQTSVHLKSFSSDETVLPTEKKLFSSINSFAWDVHPQTTYFLPRSKSNKASMLTSYDVKTGLSQQLFPIIVEQFVDSGRQLSVSKEGDFAYYTRFEKFQTEIAIIAQ